MAWSAADLRGTVASLDEWWALLTAHAPPEYVATLEKPSGGDGSVAAVEAAVAQLSLVGRRLHGSGFGPATATGTVDGIFTSQGGVPKLPIPLAQVTRQGVEGDRQAKRRYHGRLWQALSLWSAEVVEQLRDDGHPICPGAAGENLSVRGLDWNELRPGVRLRLGEVLAEFSMPVTPCRQIAACFSDADPWRIGHRKHPGATRWYASVVEPGWVRVGDEVVLEPNQDVPS